MTQKLENSGNEMEKTHSILRSFRWDSRFGYAVHQLDYYHIQQVQPISNKTIFETVL